MIESQTLIFLSILAVGIFKTQEFLKNDFNGGNFLYRNNIESKNKLIREKLTLWSPENRKIHIKCYYESLCPDSREFFITNLAPVIQKLGKYITLQTYPYGKAKTLIDKNGKVEFQCQHGPAECYGNKLHACALGILSNNTEAVLYNTCMMDYWQQGGGSDDVAADKCRSATFVNTETIKACAKKGSGTHLHKYYGDETEKVNFNYIPHILLNGKINGGRNFFRDICSILKNTPRECVQV